MPSEPAPASSVEQLTEELARAKAERDEARRALDRLGPQARQPRRARRGLVGLLVVVFAVLLPITFTVSWAHYTALNTNGWVNTVGPLASNPAVTGAVATTVADQLFTALDAQHRIAGVLPSRASFLVGPIADGIKGYVQDGVTRVVRSSQFKAIWIAANRFAHTQLVNALHGRTNALRTTDGQVVLDLVPLVNAALANVQPLVSGIAGRQVRLPSVSVNEVPSEACDAIGSAIGRTLPANCGQITLFPADRLNQARWLVRAFNGVMVLLLVLTPVIAAVALLLSTRRRRTLLQLGVGGFLALVIFRRLVTWLQQTLVATSNLGTREAREAILSRAFYLYFDISTWLLVGLAVVVAVAAVTGPYPWAQPIRREAVRLGRGGATIAVATAARARDDATLAWIRSHLDLLRVAGVVLAAILLLALSVSWVGVIVIVALLALYELWLQRFGSGTTARTDGSASGPTAGDPQGTNPPS